MIHGAPARASFLRLVLTGAVGGLLSGSFGGGGGILMVPLLVTFVGMDQRRASATSLVAIIPAAIVGSLTYVAHGSVDAFAAIFLIIGGVIGSAFGSQVMRRTPIGVLRWLFIALLLVVAVRMLLIVPTRGGADTVENSWVAALLLIGVGLFIGVASGLFGIGGGVIAVPALIALFGVGDLVAKGTSLLVMIPTAVSGTVGNLRGHVVDMRAGLIVGAAAAIASFAGVALALVMPPQASSVLFAALLVASAIQLAVRARRDRGEPGDPAQD
ncbi:sulfite exporter TauE/SafE family protein [Leifsonia sp. Leaf264]|uniref:sulfite exporter TauE/SafE family protein n=1 Tax=Leifsonia sp. Leaf264 TaxID=1736314 RepID=UPI000B036D29|nr:sulfite exporter TauE/SafE family protein [Leifsonia sp. Leaf264]